MIDRNVWFGRFDWFDRKCVFKQLGEVNPCIAKQTDVQPNTSLSKNDQFYDSKIFFSKKFWPNLKINQFKFKHYFISEENIINMAEMCTNGKWDFKKIMWIFEEKKSIKN